MGRRMGRRNGRRMGRRKVRRTIKTSGVGAWKLQTELRMTKLQTACKLLATATPEQLDAAIDAIKGNRPLVPVGVAKRKNRFAEIIDAHPRCKSDPAMAYIVKRWLDHVGSRMSCEKLKMDLDTLEAMVDTESAEIAVHRAVSNGWMTLGETKIALPGWRVKQIEEEALRNHPGNPASASYDRNAVTVEMREDFRKRSEALKGMA